MREGLYGFARQENIGIPGVLDCYRSEKNGFVAAEISERLYQPLSARLEQVGLKTDGIEAYQQYLKQFDCRFLLLIWQEQEEVRLYFFSGTRQVRALEFLDYLIPDFGLAKGDADSAGGRMSSTILNVQMADMEISKTLEYFLKMSSSYFEDCKQIDAIQYGIEHAEEIRSLPRYVKKQTPWAYVRSTDIVEQGRKLRIKSLENESGIVMASDPDIYIMIGCRGEVYDMRRDKFEHTYEATEEPLDIFTHMLDFLPEAELVPEGSFVSLDGLAHLCYPKKDAGIYARKLSERTKVFPTGDNEGYYLGRAGDYMAVRRDDLTDIYVIQEDIFALTYEEADTKFL